MGEYAEMMLDGTCCAMCGELLGRGDGFAVLCAGCDDGSLSGDLEKPHPCPSCTRRFATKRGMLDHHRDKHEGGRELVACPGCSRKVKRMGLEQHMRDKGCRTPTAPSTRSSCDPDSDLSDDGDRP